ncbi:MAG: protein kinase [Gemmatimonadales bacterium]|nr:protein kinase [Gemmatimonadales bacterium]
MSEPTRALSAAQVSALRHDLRTPVNHIVGYCELMLEDAVGHPDGIRESALRAAIVGARDVIGLIDGTLSASGRNVTRDDVVALQQRLRTPHDQIMAAVDILASSAMAGADDAFLSDTVKVRKATGTLLIDHLQEQRPPNGPAAGPDNAAIATAVRVTGRGRILVVDDVEENRDVLSRLLSRQGYQVQCAADGLEALRMAADASYDLMLLDIRMPGLDGQQVLRRVKQDPATRDLPVVMISAADDLETIAACIEAGAEDLLPKPFDPVILRARVSASVEKKRLRNREVDYLRQVDRVVEAAIAVERGQYTTGSLTAVAAREDAIGHLARVFDAMAAGVRAREERLNDQVDTLRREIDEAQWGAASGGASPLDPGTLLPGTQFGERYTITRVVGRGGMGTVYKAHDRELSEDIAIKLIRPDVLSGDPTLVDRFKSEIRLARRISHRNVVRTHDFGEWEGACYVTMEYVEGITVRDLIDMRGHLSATATIGVARQLAASLAVAHEQGVVHRDIKPQNLLLDAAGVLKVMDFGIARLADRNTVLTQAGMLVGTPAYMAPEQLMAEDVDARSDLYAAGITLYECLTGSLPYVGENPFALIAKVLHHVPPTPHERRPEIPLPLSALVMQLMAKDAGDRPANAVAMGELLAQLG